MLTTEVFHLFILLFWRTNALRVEKDLLGAKWLEKTVARLVAIVPLAGCLSVLLSSFSIHRSTLQHEEQRQGFDLGRRALSDTEIHGYLRRCHCSCAMVR